MAIEEEKVQATVESDAEQFKRDLEEIIQKVQDNAEKTVKANDKVQKSSEKTQKGIVGLFKKIIGGYQELSFKMFVWNQMLGGIKKVADKMSVLAIRTDTLNLSFKGLVATAEAFGQDGAIAEKNALRIVEMTKGMVSLEQATQGYKFLMQTFKDNEVAMQVAENALEVGAFGNVVGNLGQAFVDFGKGAKTGSIELMENIGLTQRLSSIMKRANIDISNGIDIINDRAQQQAFLNYVMEEGETFAGNLAEATDSYTASIKQNDLIIDRFLVNLGKKLQPMVKMFSDLTAKGAEFLNLFVEDSVEASDELLPLIERMKVLKETINGMKELGEDYSQQQKELTNVMNKISTISPEIVAGYDNEKNAIFDNIEAVEGLKNAKDLEIKTELLNLEKIEKNRKKELEQFNLKKESIELTIEELENEYKVGQITNKEYKKSISNLQARLRTTQENIKTSKEQISNSELEIKQLKRKKELLEGISSTEEYKEIFGLTTVTTEKKVTEDEVVTPEVGKESKVDIEGRTRRFFNERKVAYEKASKEYNDAKISFRDKLIDKYEFAMIEAEHNAEKSIYEESQKTREEMLKAKTIEDLDELKTSFRIEQNKIKSTQKLAELAIENKKDIDKKTKQEKEKTNREILKLDEQAYQERVRATEKLGEAEVRYIEDQSKAKNEFDLKIAENEIKLQREIHAKTIELNEEIRNAESLAEKQALQEKYDETLNNFVAEKSLATALLNQTLAEKESENKQLSELERQRIKDYKKNVTDYIATKAELEEELKVTEDEYRKKVLESRIKTNEEIFRLQKEQSELMKTTEDEAQREEIENYYNRLISLVEAKQLGFEKEIESEIGRNEELARLNKEQIRDLNNYYSDLEEAFDLIESVRNGEIEAREAQFEKLETLTEKEVALYKYQASKAHELYRTQIRYDKLMLGAKESFVAGQNEMLAQLYNNEDVNGKLIVEVMKRNMQEYLLAEGTKLFGVGIAETVYGFQALAHPSTAPFAPAMFTAAGKAFAGSAALGVVSAALTGTGSSESRPSTSYESEKTKAETEATETQELEKTKTEYDVVNINFDEASRDMTMLVMRQAEHLVKEGYDFALVKKK